VKARIEPDKRSHFPQQQHVSADATNEHATPYAAALSADHYLEELYTMSVVLDVIWSVLLCFFEVTFFWQRVRHSKHLRMAYQY
jgi:hypothetical protein